MAEGVNIFDLAAIISVSMGDSERKITELQKRVLDLEKQLKALDATAGKTGKRGSETAGQFGRLSDVFKGLSTTTTTLDGPLGGVASRLRSLGSLSSELTTGAGALGVAFGALAVVSIGLGVALYKIVTSAAESAGKFKDLSQQTGFTVETLNALSQVADTSGGSIDTVTGSLIIFQKNMEAAHDKTSEMSRIFKLLNIDTNDNEKALRQAFEALSKMNKEQQVSIGAKLFGRSIKDLNAIIKEGGGSIDALIEKLKAAGTLLSGEAADKADELSDAIVIMGHQFEATKRVIAEQFAPDVLKAITSLTQTLNENKATLKSWGETFAGAMRGIGSIAQSEVGTVIKWVIELEARLNPLLNLLRLLKQIGPPAAGTPPYAGYGVLTEQGRRAQVFGELADKAIKNNQDVPRINFPSGGGGGGAAKIAPGQQLLNQLTAEYNRLQEKTLELSKFDVVQKELQDKKYKGLSASLREQIEEMATYITMDEKAAEAEKKKSAVLKEVDDFIAKQKEAIIQATEKGDEWDKGIRKITASIIEAGAKIDEERFKLIKSNDAKLKAIALTEFLAINAERLSAALADMPDLPPGIQKMAAISSEERLKGLTDTVNAGIGLPPLHQTEDQIKAFKDKMRDLAAGLTNTIDRALSDGFSRGIKAGIVSFAQGILEMIRSAALQALEQKLFEVFSKGLGGGGGGGWLGKLLGIGIGVAAGAAGGGGGFGTPGSAQGSVVWGASGGIVPGVDRGYDTVRAMLRPGEMVLNKDQQKGLGGGGNVYMTVYAKDAQSFVSRDTQAQISRQYSRILQKRALTG